MRPLAIQFALTALLLPSGALLAADDPRPTYSLRQEAPSTGSNLRREIAGGSVVPVDKKYSELTREEQLLVKSQYDQMGPSDEPPFPLNGLAPIYKAIATGQNKFLATGNLVLFVSINEKGDATSVSVLSSPDPEMTRFAASVLLVEKYKPALCNGAPCAMQFPFRIALKTRF